MAKVIRGRWAVIVICVLTVLCYGGVFGLARLTLVNPWYPALGGVAVAAAAYIPAGRAWAGITGCSNRFVAFLSHLVAATGLVLALFYTLNYCIPRTGSSHIEEAEVVRRYSETRYTQKRVARNRYVRGEPYNAYFVEVRLPGGWERSFQIPLQRYNSTQPGKKLRMEMKLGLFGIPVVSSPFCQTSVEASTSVGR